MFLLSTHLLHNTEVLFPDGSMLVATSDPNSAILRTKSLTHGLFSGHSDSNYRDKKSPLVLSVEMFFSEGN
jgi:hypothetical protein